MSGKRIDFHEVATRGGFQIQPQLVPADRKIARVRCGAGHVAQLQEKFSR